MNNATLTGLFLSALIFSSMGMTQSSFVSINHQGQTANHFYVAKIKLHSPEELLIALKRASDYQSELAQGFSAPPIEFLLHGREAKALLKVNYSEHKSLIDLARKLSADKVVNIQVCRSWMSFHDLEAKDFASFVEAIKYAPSEISRLIEKDGYVYF